MRRQVTVLGLQQNFGEYVSQVQSHGDSGVVTKDGQPVAALVDYPLFEKIRALPSLFDELSTRIGSIYAGVPAAVAQAEIDEAVRRVRRHPR